MKRMLCGAFALLLLFGTLGCRIGSNAPEAPTDAAETAAPTDAPETTAEAAAEETRLISRRIKTVSGRAKTPICASTNTETRS